MPVRYLLALGLAAATPTLAHAWEETSLPLMAQDSAAFTTKASPWTSDVFARSPFAWSVFGSGIAPANTQFSGLTHKLDEKTFMGVRTMTGFASSLSGPGFNRGYGFSATEVKFAHISGPMRTWMSASFGSATASRLGGPYGLVGDPAARFTNGQNPTFGRVSAGFDYAISEKATLSFGVSVGTANGFGRGFGNGFGGPLGMGR
ncbi:MAG: hypothetical protein AB7F96_05950 [Beijerinckiaceae bacterium]